MNQLPLAKRTQILGMLVDGSSIGSISRVAGVSINTVLKLLVEAGEACLAIHNDEVRNVPAKRVQCHQIWSFCYAKQANVKTAKAAPEDAGDVWTWTAIDADSKLIVSYLVGGRNADYATELIYDLIERLSNRVQLTTDGAHACLEAASDAFSDRADYAQLVKLYGPAVAAPHRYSPAACSDARKRRVSGPHDVEHVSTSYVERQNLTRRMLIRRFAAKALSKKLDNHIHTLALYFTHYNFCRFQKMLRASPAMAAGITNRLWSFEDIVAKMDEAAPIRKPRGPHK